jgi:copper(I)-binding protein
VIRPGNRPGAATRRSSTVLLIGAVVGGIALGGCGAGQIAQTAYQANNGGGADASTNGIDIRAAQIEFGDAPEGAAVHAAGSSAPVAMYIINLGGQDDRLVSASSPAAASVQINGPTDLPAGTSMVVGGNFGTAGQTLPGESEPPAKPPLDATVAPETPNAPPQSTPASAAQEPSDVSPTSGANPSGEAPAAGLRTPPPLAEISPSTRFTQIVLTGLREDIRAGLSYEMDLTFERAGVVRVSLPVGYPGVPRPAAEHGG